MINHILPLPDDIHEMTSSDDFVQIDTETSKNISDESSSNSEKNIHIRRNSRIFDNDYVRRHSILLQDNNANAISKYINIKSLTSRVKWTKSDEKIVKNYIYKALAYKSLYNQAYFAYSFYNKLITWPLIILTCINLLLQTIYVILITIDAIGYSGTVTFGIIIATITTTVGSLTYWRSKKNFHGSSKGCRKAAIAFSEFIDQLNTILSIDKEHRTNPLEVINTIQYDYKKIRKFYAEFQIPSSIYKKFTKMHDDLLLSTDIVAGRNMNFNIFDNNYDKNIITENFVGELLKMRHNSTDTYSDPESVIENV